MEREKKCMCADCGEFLGSDTRACPICGSVKKRVFFVARDTIQAFGGIIEEAEDQLRKIKHESVPTTKGQRGLNEYEK